MLGFLWQIWYNALEVIVMETKDAIRAFRTKKGLSQDELAEKVFVTRQAGSPRGARGPGPRTDPQN